MLKLRHKGFSLIELMVAMALGSFIIAGLVSVFIGASRSYSTQQALVEVQSKGRFAIEKLREDIQLGGLGISSSEQPVRFVPVGGTTDCDNSVYEVLEISFNRNNAGANSISCYYLNTANNQLMRNQTIEGTAATVAQAVPIVDSVDQIEFFYSVDTDGNGIDVTAGSIYQTAATLAAAAAPNWKDVVAVRIELVVASNTDRVLDERQILVNPFDRNPPTNISANNGDTRLHQAYTALVSLRNRI
ncbi:MAG: PilW family protein [Oceanospirillaceae bacterium]